MIESIKQTTSIFAIVPNLFSTPLRAWRSTFTMYRPASFVISVVAALLWAVSLTTAIKITNKDFDVKNDELFELKWSGQGNERVNIELATYPGHSVVHELYCE